MAGTFEILTEKSGKTKRPKSEKRLRDGTYFPNGHLITERP
jgi:hypothetical protein